MIKRILRLTVLLLAFCMLASISTACSVSDPSAKQSKDASIDYDLASLDMAAQYQQSLPIRTDFGNKKLEPYMGKSVHMRGLYQKSGYDFLIVQDITLCCYADFELLYDGTYPETGSEIEVTGVFDSYSDSEGTWPCIRIETMKVLAPPANS